MTIPTGCPPSRTTAACDSWSRSAARSTVSPWPMVGSGQCDANGNFTLQIPVSKTTPYQYFRAVFP